MDKEIKVGDNYNGAKVISVGIQEATEYGIHGEARLPVDKRYIGRKYAIVQGEGRATWKVWLSYPPHPKAEPGGIPAKDTR